MNKFLNNIDVNEIKKGAEKILAVTEEGAKKAYSAAKEEYDGLSSETKRAITVGLSVFAIVLIVAGCFYLLGKRAGKKDQAEFEYEEWDG